MKNYHQTRVWENGISIFFVVNTISVSANLAG
jgi:hypothetical protein